jgi:hypothetical protein
VTKQRLDTLWGRFNSLLVEPLPKPRLRVVLRFPEHSQEGETLARIVTLSVFASERVAYHEFAHHLWNVRDVGHSLLGARFLAAARLGLWDSPARELFADSMAWLLCGRWRRGWPRSVKAANVLRVLFKEET